MLIHIAAERITVTASKATAEMLKSIGGKFDGSQWTCPVAALPALRRSFPAAKFEEALNWRQDAARLLCQRFNRVGLSVMLRYDRVCVVMVNGVELPPQRNESILHELEFDIMALLQAGEDFTVTSYGNSAVDEDPDEIDNSLEAKLLRGWKNAAEAERRHAAIARRRYTQSMRKERV